MHEYQKTSLTQLYTSIDGAITHNLHTTGFGSLALDLEPNCHRSSLVRLRNSVHYGFELERGDIEGLRRGYLPGEVQAQHLPIWEHLHGSLLDIWSAQGHGHLTLDFERIKRDRGAVVTLRGGPSYRILLPRF